MSSNKSYFQFHSFRNETKDLRKAGIWSQIHSIHFRLKFYISNSSVHSLKKMQWSININFFILNFLVYKVTEAIVLLDTNRI